MRTTDPRQHLLPQSQLQLQTLTLLSINLINSQSFHFHSRSSNRETIHASAVSLKKRDSRMDLTKYVKSPVLHDAAFARRVCFRVFLFASAVSIIPIVYILTSYDFKSFHLPKSPPCHAGGGANPDQLPRGSYLFQGHFLNPVWDSFDSAHCQENVNLTISVIRDLVDEKHLFNHSARTLFVGGSSSSAASVLRDLGFPGAVGVDKGRYTSLEQREVGYKLDYRNDSFDFVLFRGKLKVSVPDLVVGEIERILDGGGVGALVIGRSGEISMRLGVRVGKLLKHSCVVHRGNINKMYLSVFKKKQFHHLPMNCSTQTNFQN